MDKAIILNKEEERPSLQGPPELIAFGEEPRTKVRYVKEPSILVFIGLIIYAVVAIGAMVLMLVMKFVGKI